MESEALARHGSAYDRGSADRYYGRPFRPHYFKGATYMSDEVTELTEDERKEYARGWAECIDRKSWD